MFGVLYYPYIRVPEDAWFTRVLLYWDEVATIVPSGYIYEPQELGEYTLGLVQEELVRQVFPESTDLEDLRDRFVEHVSRLSSKEIRKRKKALKREDTSRIHQNKMMDKLGDVLERQFGLAIGLSGDWWEVESKTATDYMAALALRLGEIYSEKPESPLVPITDQKHNLASMLDGFKPRERRGGLRFQGEAEYGELREAVLPRLLPGPDHRLEPREIRAFQSRHGDLLPAFRREVERRLELLVHASKIDTQRELERIDEELSEDRAAVEEALMRTGLVGRLVRSDFVMLLRLFPPVDVVATIFEAATNVQTPSLSPLAYATHARVELLQPSSGRKRGRRERGSSVTAFDSAGRRPLSQV